MPLKITIDTREKTPWHFPAEYAETKIGTLSAGDYAIQGDKGFAIERKTLNDFIGTISSGWERFQAELERMKDLEFPAQIIVIEANLCDVINHQYNHPDVQPKFVLLRIAQLTYAGVCVLFAGNVFPAAYMAWNILRQRQQSLLQVGLRDR